jgi:pilus assembly protein Flp/PilA
MGIVNHHEGRSPIHMNMLNFLTWLSNKAKSERGAGLAEYALLLALIAIACIAALTTLGTAISSVLTSIAGRL